MKKLPSLCFRKQRLRFRIFSNQTNKRLGVDVKTDQDSEASFPIEHLRRYDKSKDTFDIVMIAFSACFISTVMLILSAVDDEAGQKLFFETANIVFWRSFFALVATSSFVYMWRAITRNIASRKQTRIDYVENYLKRRSLRQLRRIADSQEFSSEERLLAIYVLDTQYPGWSLRD